MPSEIEENLANLTPQKFIKFFAERRLRKIATANPLERHFRNFQEIKVDDLVISAESLKSSLFILRSMGWQVNPASPQS